MPIATGGACRTHQLGRRPAAPASHSAPAPRCGGRSSAAGPGPKLLPRAKHAPNPDAEDVTAAPRIRLANPFAAACLVFIAPGHLPPRHGPVFAAPFDPQILPLHTLADAAGSTIRYVGGQRVATGSRRSSSSCRAQETSGDEVSREVRVPRVRVFKNNLHPPRCGLMPSGQMSRASANEIARQGITVERKCYSDPWPTKRPISTQMIASRITAAASGKPSFKRTFVRCASTVRELI
jgi:hypothetical protein